MNDDNERQLIMFDPPVEKSATTTPPPPPQDIDEIPPWERNKVRGKDVVGLFAYIVAFIAAWKIAGVLAAIAVPIFFGLLVVAYILYVILT